MPPIEYFELNQTAVLKPYTDVDSNGEKTVGTAVELAVRWETKKVESTTSDGTPVVLDAVVMTKQEVAVGSRMWLGTLKDWNAQEASPPSDFTDREIYEVVMYSAIPDIKGKNVRYLLGLVRYRQRA